MSKISPKQIAEAIYLATESKQGSSRDEVVKRTVSMLKKKRLMHKAKDVVNALEDILDRKTETVRMKVVSANHISKEERHKIETDVKHRYKAKHVIGEFQEDETLLGGLRVEVGDEVLDTTYKNRLHQLERFLVREK